MKDEIRKSYTLRIAIFTILPLIVIGFLSYYQISSVRKNIIDTENVKKAIYATVLQFYEISYLQKERELSVLYILTRDESIKKDLVALETGVEYEYLFELNRSDIIKFYELRQQVLLDKVSTKEIMNSYSSLISDFILNMSQFQYRNITNPILLKTLRIYENMVKLKENYHILGVTLLESLILKSENKIDNTSFSKYQLQFYQNIKNNIVASIYNLADANKRQELQKFLSGKEFINFDLTLDKIIDNIKLENNERGIDNNKQNILTIEEQFFNFISHNISEMEAISTTLNEDAKFDLNVTLTLVVVIVLFGILSGIILKNNIINSFAQYIRKINASNEEKKELLNSVDRYVIMTKTDLKGHITYASDAFCKVSGYTMDEVIGKPHNIVRHPDMPKDAFKRMWETIRNGQIWTGEVKNRTKDGGFYWVKARITPIFENGAITGYSSIRNEITEHKKSKELHESVNNLLDNANDGFVSFDENFLILDGYSAKSKELFGNISLLGENISEILFGNNKKLQEIFENGIKKLVNIHNVNAADMILDLLPKENTVNDKIFAIQCKILRDNKFMLILRDVTLQKALEEKIAYENKIQKMIVVIATRRYEFVELKDKFMDFLNNIEQNVDFNLRVNDNIALVSAALHTYKGLFDQEELVNIPIAIHELETKIYDLKNAEPTNHDLLVLLVSSNLKEEFDKDLKFIYEILGEDFFQSINMIAVNKTLFLNIETKMEEMMKKSNISKQEFDEMAMKFFNVNQKYLKELLSIYPKRVENISKRLEKDIAPLQIEGDASITIQGGWSVFINSLVHVFRNMVDHGIELPDVRTLYGKDSQGIIQCKFDYTEDKEHIQIVIEDDGAGIDIEKVKARALKYELYSANELNNMTESEIFNILFSENFTTKDDSSLVSGRGIGLSAVKKEVDTLGGQIIVESQQEVFTRFTFLLPTHKQLCEFTNHEAIYMDVLSSNMHNFLEETYEIEVDEVISDEDMNIEDNYAVINFMFDDQSKILNVLSVNDETLKFLIGIFFSECSIEDLASNEKNEVVGEILNTVMGYVGDEVKNIYGKHTLGTPVELDKSVLEIVNKTANTRNIIMKTIKGNLYLSTIFYGK